MTIAKSLKSLNLNFKVTLFILAGASNINSEFKFSKLHDLLIHVDYIMYMDYFFTETIKLVYLAGAVNGTMHVKSVI